MNEYFVLAEYSFSCTLSFLLNLEGPTLLKIKEDDFIIQVLNLVRNCLSAFLLFKIHSLFENSKN